MLCFKNRKEAAKALKVFSIFLIGCAVMILISRALAIFGHNYGDRLRHLGLSDLSESSVAIIAVVSLFHAVLVAGLTVYLGLRGLRVSRKQSPALGAWPYVVITAMLLSLFTPILIVACVDSLEPLAWADIQSYLMTILFSAFALAAAKSLS